MYHRQYIATSTPASHQHTAGLPPELWLKILSEGDLKYLDLTRISAVNKDLNQLIKHSALDSFLFRSALSAQSIAEGTSIKLHPILMSAYLFIAKAENASIYGLYADGRDFVFYKAMDYLARLENATEPSLNKFYLNLKDFGPPGAGGWVESSRGEGQPVSVEDVLKKIAELWMVKGLPGRSGGKPELTWPKNKLDHQLWEGWQKPFKMGKSGFVLTSRGLGS